MSIEHQHVALPKLTGAPAYGRPPRPVEPTAVPFDPDALPIEATMSDEERAFAASLPAGAYVSARPIAPSGEATAADAAPARDAKPLKAIATRLLRRGNASNEPR